MKKALLATILILVVIFIVPFIVYGIFATAWGLQTPQPDSPLNFLLSVFVSKIGTAICFTLLFRFASDYYHRRWFLYSLIWCFMFLFGEIGQTLTPGYTPTMALAGVISEAIYLPLSAYLLHRIFTLSS
jgi:hypothetical protein